MVLLKVHVKWLLASVLTIVPGVIAFTTPKFIFLSILGLRSLTSPDRDEPAFHTALYNFCLWDGTPNEPCCARSCRGRCLIGPFCRSRRRRAREAMADRELRVHIARFVLARYAVHQSYVAHSGSYDIEDQEEYSQMERRYDRMLKATADLSIPARAFAVGGAPLLNTRPDGTHAPPGAETACEVEARRILRGADSIVRGPVVRTTAYLRCTRVCTYKFTGSKLTRLEIGGHAPSPTEIHNHTHTTTALTHAFPFLFLLLSQVRCSMVKSVCCEVIRGESMYQQIVCNRMCCGCAGRCKIEGNIRFYHDSSPVVCCWCCKGKALGKYPVIGSERYYAVRRRDSGANAGLSVVLYDAP